MNKRQMKKFKKWYFKAWFIYLSIFINFTGFSIYQANKETIELAGFCFKYILKPISKII